MLQSKAWYDKYAPKTVAECILPEHTAKTFANFVANKDIPNLLLSGSPGIGKTSVAIAMCEEIGAEYIKINASLNGNIDTIRNDVQQFASSISLNGERKYVILDEAERLSAATQEALRGFIDEYKDNCGFIFTCNYRERILAPISESRIMEISFLFKAEEKQRVAKHLYSLLARIFEAEKVAFDTNAVRQFVVDHLKRSTDFRRFLVQAQKIVAINGTFNNITITNTLTERFTALFEALKAKNFAQARTWIGENADIEAATIYRTLYDNAKEINPTMVGALVLIIARYQYQHAFVTDGEINLAACMVEIMTEVV